MLSPPLPPLPRSAEILRISGRVSRKETISCPAGKLAFPEIVPRPPRMSPGTI
jgi:hypothetical protein